MNFLYRHPNAEPPSQRRTAIPTPNRNADEYEQHHRKNGEDHHHHHEADSTASDGKSGK